MKDDSTFIEKAQKGDGEAFGKLYDAYVTRIYRFIFLRVGNRHDTEDLTQQVFMNAWQHVGDYEAKGFPFTSWLYRIAVNAVIDHYRTARSTQPLETVPEEIVAQPARFEEDLGHALDFNRIRTALVHLEEDQQNVILMRFVDDLTTREIAQALGKTEGAIRVIQHRALKLLKISLNNNGGSTTSTIKEA